MNRIIFIILTICLLAAQIASADENLSYVDGSKPFLSIENVNRQAEAWATCAAAYEIAAKLSESTPAKAKRYKEFSNGAVMAIMMTHVSTGLSNDITPEKFNALWNSSKIFGQSIPETMRTMILADAEKGEDTFIDKLVNTVIVCETNLQGQQYYIDMWRELLKNGLLAAP